MTEKLISRTVDNGQHGYSLTHIHATPRGQVVRVRVYRPHDDAGAGEPSAAAAVYDHAANEWKSVTELGSMSWYPDTSDSTGTEEMSIVDQLNPAATRLYEQARDILSYAPPPANAPDALTTIVSVERVDFNGNDEVIAVYPDPKAARRAVIHVNNATGTTRVQMGNTLLVSPSGEQLLDFVERVNRAR